MPVVGREASGDAHFRLRLDGGRQGRVWAQGETAVLRYRKLMGRGSGLRVAVSSDGGRSWSTVNARKPRPGVFRWVVSASESELQVRLCDGGGRAVSNTVMMAVGSRIVDVGFAQSFAVALMADGSLRAWGYFRGVDGNTESSWRKPRAIAGVDAVRMMAVGGDSVVIERTDGTVSMIKESDLADARVDPVPVIGVSGVNLMRAEYGGVFVRLIDGSVMAWGSNEHGCLGDGSTLERLEPVEIHALRGAVEIALGRFAGAALMGDGRVMTWGWNASGQAGDGTTRDSSYPREVVGIGRAAAVSMRGQWMMALLEDGTVLAWGDNRLAQLGRDLGGSGASPSPAPIPELEGVQAIACGFETGFAILDDGRGVAWGSGGAGQLCNGRRTTSRVTARPIRASDVSRLCVGDGTVHMFDRQGRHYGWGSNAFGLVGDGSERDRLRPRRLKVK